MRGDKVKLGGMYLSIEVYRGTDDGFVASCPELDLQGLGHTQKEAVESLKFEVACFLNGAGARYIVDDEIKYTYLYHQSGHPSIN